MAILDKQRYETDCGHMACVAMLAFTPYEVAVSFFTRTAQDACVILVDEHKKKDVK